MTVKDAPVSAVTSKVRLMMVKDVAEMLKIHPRSVWRLSALAEDGHGNFPRALRLAPKTVRWRLSDVEKYVSDLAEGR